MDKKEITIDTYNKSAKQMAEKFNNLSRVKDVEMVMNIWAKENLGKNPKVVELGCGNGRDAYEILKFTDDYLGVDASVEMIKLAKEYIPTGNFLVEKIEDFEFGNGTDIIFAFASFLHLDKKEIFDVLEKAKKSLSKNGLIYISVKLGKYEEREVVDKYGIRTFYFYELQDFEEIGRKTGFEILNSKVETLKEVEWLEILLRSLG